MEQTFCSRIWRLGDNIDTDIIIMSKYLAKPSLREPCNLTLVILSISPASIFRHYRKEIAITRFYFLSILFKLDLLICRRRWCLICCWNSIFFILGCCSR